MLQDALTGWVLFAGLPLAVGTVAGRWIIVPQAFGADAEIRGRLITQSAVPAFSRVALASVTLLVLTGLYATWSHIERFGALVATPYGRSLAFKLLLVGIVLAFGARNARILAPRLGTDAGDHAMQRSAAVELAVGQLVLLVTSVLVRTSPMGH